MIKHSLTNESKEVTIGRHIESQINFTQTDQSVSRRHANIIARSIDEDTTHFYMNDISSFGTYVNGKKVSRDQRLVDMDKIYFGASEDAALFLRPFCCPHPDFEGPVICYTQGISVKWERRWMCLYRDMILLFEEKDDKYPVHFIDLACAFVTGTKKPKNSWAITVRKRVDYFTTRKEEEKSHWLAAIAFASGHTRKNPITQAALSLSIK